MRRREFITLLGASGECFCRRQPNAIGGTRDQNLLVVHGTAIQG